MGAAEAGVTVKTVNDTSNNIPTNTVRTFCFFM
jgi:hypothetical protein